MHRFGGSCAKKTKKRHLAQSPVQSIPPMPYRFSKKSQRFIETAAMRLADALSDCKSANASGEWIFPPVTPNESTHGIPNAVTSDA
jgi:hypothetical protein